MGARIAISFPIVTCFVHFLVKNYKKVDIYVNLGYIYKHKRDSRIGCEYGGNIDFQITQKPRGCLASEPLVPKNRVWVSVYKGLSGFCPEFSRKKSPAQFAFGFGCTEPRPDWVQNRGSSHVPSRLKGIETLCGAGNLSENRHSSHVPSRLKGIETKRCGNWGNWNTVHTCLPV